MSFGCSHSPPEPETIPSGLVSHSTSLIPSGSNRCFLAKASVENVYADRSKVTDKLVDRYFELTLREGNRQAFVDRLNMSTDKSSFQKIRLIQKRTLILWGEEDKLIPLKMAHRFHNDLQNDTLVILKGLGHIPMEESPNQSLVPVMSFLKNVE